MATGLTVGDNDLVNEALDMIESQGVIEIMQNYGYDPNDRSGKDLTTLWNEIFNNRWGLMMNPCTDLHNLFKGFDSHWHNTAQNQAQVTYTGCSSAKPVVALGTEVNYYFQGVLFRIFGYSITNGLNWVGTWKTVTGHGGVNGNIQFFFKKGWSELPGFWGRALIQHQVNLNTQEKVRVRKLYKQGKLGPQ